MHQVPGPYLDFRTDVIRHNTKNHGEGKRPQKKHGIEQKARNEVALLQKVDTCRCASSC